MGELFVPGMLRASPREGRIGMSGDLQLPEIVLATLLSFDGDGLTLPQMPPAVRAARQGAAAAATDDEVRSALFQLVAEGRVLQSKLPNGEIRFRLPS